MGGTRIPAANLLLSFAILVAGGTATKALRFFSHMGLACISLKTYLKHQRASFIEDNNNLSSISFDVMIFFG